MATYASALHTVSLAGPTLFGQVIDKAAEIAGQSFSHYNCKYHVLFIITDGVLTDIQETKNALMNASNLPLSAGLGSTDFAKMEILDADNGPLLQSTTGQVAMRDIVQFVPMRNVQRDELSVVQLLKSCLSSS